MCTVTVGSVIKSIYLAQSGMLLPCHMYVHILPLLLATLHIQYGVAAVHIMHMHYLSQHTSLLYMYMFMYLDWLNIVTCLWCLWYRNVASIPTPSSRIGAQCAIYCWRPFTPQGKGGRKARTVSSRDACCVCHIIT